jgi:hypothetical protein
MAFDSQVRKRLGLGPTVNLTHLKSWSGGAAALASPALAELLVRRAQPMPSLRDLAIVFGDRSRRLHAWLSNATAPPFGKTRHGGIGPAGTGRLAPCPLGIPSLRDLASVFGERSRRLRAWLSNATAPPFGKTRPGGTGRLAPCPLGMRTTEPGCRNESRSDEP